jgi:hypothetical protein
MHRLIIQEDRGRCHVSWLGLRAVFGPEGLPGDWQGRVEHAPARAAICHWMAAPGMRKPSAQPGAELARLLAASLPDHAP